MEGGSMKRLLMVIITAVLLSSLLFAGCGSKNDSAGDNNVKTGKEVNLGNISKVPDKYRNLKEWNGSWETFSDYCRDDALESAWKSISEDAGIREGKLKNTFENLCFISDDIVRFKISDGTITAVDSAGKRVFKNKYKLIGVFGPKSKRTVVDGEKSYLFKAEKKAGRYEYLCMMPICTMEKNDMGIDMVSHFHFNYGSDIKTATDRSGIPTMVEDGVDDSAKSETLLAFFLGK